MTGHEDGGSSIAAVRRYPCPAGQTVQPELVQDLEVRSEDVDVVGHAEPGVLGETQPATAREMQPPAFQGHDGAGRRWRRERHQRDLRPVCAGYLVAKHDGAGSADERTRRFAIPGRPRPAGHGGVARAAASHRPRTIPDGHSDANGREQRERRAAPIRA